MHSNGTLPLPLMLDARCGYSFREESRTSDFYISNDFLKVAIIFCIFKIIIGLSISYCLLISILIYLLFF